MFKILILFCVRLDGVASRRKYGASCRHNEAMKQDGAKEGQQRNSRLRLGTYQYLDMHMAIASALTTFENEVNPLLKQKAGPGT